MSDLKPCAHCGGTAQKIVAPFGFAIECEECGAQSNYRDSITAAGEAWNRRTQPETVDGDPIGDLQAESRQAKLDDFIASMKTQPEATAPAQDLSAAILARQIIQDTNDTLREQSEGLKQLKAENDQLRAALVSSANALSAGDSEKQRIALIAAVQNYLVDVVRSFGDVSCAAYISTWHKPETINAAILQSQKGGNNG